MPAAVRPEDSSEESDSEKDGIGYDDDEEIDEADWEAELEWQLQLAENPERPVSNWRCVGEFVIAHQQTSGGRREFKHQLAKNRLVWGDRPCKCKGCGKTLYFNFVGDIFHYLSIKHPVISVLLVPPLHPYSRGERAVTLAIGFLFSFFISVLIQDPQLSMAGAVIISIFTFVAEQLATCSCAQTPGMHWFIRATVENVGNIIQIAMLLAAFAFAWGGAKIFTGKNGDCYAVNGTGLSPTGLYTDTCPTAGTQLCQNASSHIRFKVKTFAQTLDCSFSPCEGKCLLPAPLTGITPVLVQQAISLGQSWLVIWPLANAVLWFVKHRKERKDWARNEEFYARTAGDTAGDVIATAATQHGMCGKCTQTWRMHTPLPVVQKQKEIARLEQGLAKTEAAALPWPFGLVATRALQKGGVKKLPPLTLKKQQQLKLKQEQEEQEEQEHLQQQRQQRRQQQHQQQQPQQQQQQQQEAKSARRSRKENKEAASYANMHFFGRYENGRR
jgi:hypothetical protein